MKITHEHLDAALRQVAESGNYSVLAVFNAAQDMAEASKPEEYITAEQARALGAGNAEFYYHGGWVTCSGYCYPNTPKYRAIKQPMPDPHAELKALYAQQVLYGTLDDYVWEYVDDENSAWFKVTKPIFVSGCEYRCTPKPPKLKQLDWSKVPVGTMTNKGELRGTYTDSDGLCADIEKDSIYDHNGLVMDSHEIDILRIAPAGKQRWIAVQDDESSRLYEGLNYAKQYDNMICAIAYKVIGLALGYTDGGEA